MAANPKTQQRALTRAKDVDLKAWLTKSAPALQQVASRYCSPEKLIKVALIARAKTPKLADCSTTSILSSLMQCAQLGLYPSDTLQHCALIPYYNKNTNTWECQMQIMVAGLVELGRRHGDITNVRARLVYEGDEFEHVEGLERDLVHRPSLDGPTGDWTHVYAICEMRGGGFDFEVMTPSEIAKVRATAKAQDHGPWATWTEQMIKKTCVKRLLRRQRLSDEIADALAQDDTPATDGGAILDLGEDKPQQLDHDPETGEVFEVYTDDRPDEVPL